MENLNAKAVSFSFGILAALVFIACWIFVAILPLEAIIKVSNSMMHGIDTSSIASKGTGFAESLLGLAIAVLGSMALGYIFAVVYNWLNEQIK